MLFNQIKQVLTYYEESVPSANADRLYFLKQHTLISELVFDEINANYQVKGYKKE